MAFIYTKTEHFVSLRLPNNYKCALSTIAMMEIKLCVVLVNSLPMPQKEVAPSTVLRLLRFMYNAYAQINTVMSASGV